MKDVVDVCTVRKGRIHDHAFGLFRDLLCRDLQEISLDDLGRKVRRERIGQRAVDLDGHNMRGDIDGAQDVAGSS